MEKKILADFHICISVPLSIKHYFEKNSYPISFPDQQVKFFLENKINDKSVTVNATSNVAKYYKLTYIGHTSTDAKRKISRFCKFCCKSLNLRLF